MAPKYHRMMCFWERVLFTGGREWACLQARGDVLEIAIGRASPSPLIPNGWRWGSRGSRAPQKCTSASPALRYELNGPSLGSGKYRLGCRMCRSTGGLNGNGDYFNTLKAAGNLKNCQTSAGEGSCG
jgi:hypothetical protein